MSISTREALRQVKLHVADGIAVGFTTLDIVAYAIEEMRGVQVRNFTPAGCVVTEFVDDHELVDFTLDYTKRASAS